MIVLNYLLALLGLTLLCALWMKFQLWLKRIDPQREGFKPGCGACQGGGCGTTTETTIKRKNFTPSVKVEILGKLSGESECKEKKSPSSAEVR